jgi:hypothetical protein
MVRGSRLETITEPLNDEPTGLWAEAATQSLGSPARINSPDRSLATLSSVTIPATTPDVGNVYSVNETNSLTIGFDALLGYMQRAAVIYNEDSAAIREAFPNTRTITTLGDKGLKYFLEEAPTDGHQILTIRGTDNLTNSLQDFEYTFTFNQDLGIYAHKGFSDDAKAIFQQLLSDGTLSRTKPIAITGHSLGGALANLLLCYCQKNGYPILPSATFGQPKVTNAHGVDLYQDIPLTRVVYENDIIPFLPPTTLLTSCRGPYKHHGDEVILLEVPFYCHLDEHDVSRKSLDSFWKNMLHERKADHAIPRYVSALADKQVLAQEVPYEKRNEYVHPVRRIMNWLPCCRC